MKHFDRSRLPSPPAYFDALDLKLHGRGTWRSARCCFHDDHTPSLRVNVETGGFRCLSCNAHGRDVLDFERLRTGKGFADAARDLGAWR